MDCRRRFYGLRCAWRVCEVADADADICQNIIAYLEELEGFKQLWYKFQSDACYCDQTDAESINEGDLR